MKSILNIHKEIIKKEYEKSPLGQMEKKLRRFYESGEVLSEEAAKLIFDIRREHEKKQEEYIELTNKQHREETDKMLFDAWTKELAIIEKHHGEIL